MFSQTYKNLSLLSLLVLSLVLLLSPQVSSAQAPGTVLSIPSINVYASTFHMPIVNQNGQPVWYLDPWETRVGHLERTAWLDEAGSIVIGGHLELPDGTPGVFSELEKVQVGDIITITENNVDYQYQVVTAGTILRQDLSIVLSENTQLALFTCNGEYDPSIRDYPTRFVVVAEPLQ